MRLKLRSAAVLFAAISSSAAEATTDRQQRQCAALAKSVGELATQLRVEARARDGGRRFNAAPGADEPEIVRAARERAIATDAALSRAMRTHADAVDDYGYELQRCAREG
jgi:hypothetical protein